MKVSFTKMHGCGNDYIYLDCFSPEVADHIASLSLSTLAIALSDRHTGIGGDGLVLIRRSSKADASMQMFNQDGSEGAMCGNAIRCVACYLYDQGIVTKTDMTIDTLSGIKALQLSIQQNRVHSIQVDMGIPQRRAAQIPVLWNKEYAIDLPLSIQQQDYLLTCISMGNPHAVIFCDEIEQLDLAAIGPQIEQHPLFPERINTEFVKVVDRQHLQMRVWERGSGETRACGTGACASVVAAILHGFCDQDEDILVSLPGGDLIIRYTKEHVILQGPCTLVFHGTIDL